MSYRLRPPHSPKTGQELRVWRERLGWSQLTLSIKADIDKVTVWRAERGRFNAETLWKILAALKAGDAEAVCGQDERRVD